MKKIAWWAMSTITACGLLLGYHTSQPNSDQTTAAYAPLTPGTSDTAATGGTTDSSNAASGSAGSSNASGSTTGASDTYTGTAINTRFGPVQVQITVVNGRVTAANAVEYPNTDGKDVAINSRAIPVLNKEAVATQSASIDTVSGATYTSQAYIQSLQSALDQAGI